MMEIIDKDSRPAAHDAKKGADSSTKNTSNPQNLFGRSAQLAQKFGTSLKKGFVHRVSVFRGMLHDANAHLLPLSRKVIRTITIP